MIDFDATFDTFPQLTTERFVLRELMPTDIGPMFQIMSDPQTMQHFGQPPMTLRLEAELRINSIYRAFVERDGIRWGIERRSDGALIGSCGFWRLVSEHATAEIGYELDRACWGQGVMTEAAGAILTFGFEVMRLHRVEAHIAPPNIGSRRVLEKLGFVQEGYFRQSYYLEHEQRFDDDVVFSLLRPI